MDLIWRLETRKKEGAYTALQGFTGRGEGNYYGENHPCPGDDGIGYVSHNLIFGFTSLDDTRRWWYNVSDLRLWDELGLRLAIWPASTSSGIEVGRHQCAFKRPPEDPLYLPAFAIHEVPLDVILAMVSDKFNQEKEATHDYQHHSRQWP